MGRAQVVNDTKLAEKAILAAAFLPTGSDLNVRDPNNQMTISRLLELINIVRKLGEKPGDAMTPQQFQIVLEVAKQPGITMQGLEKATGLALASISRNLMALGEYHRLGKAGLNLVETVDDPNERRRKIAFLTKKGKKYVEDLITAIRGERVVFDSPTSREHLSKAYSGNIR